MKPRTINIGAIEEARIYSDKEPGIGSVVIETDKYNIKFEIDHDNIQCFAAELWRFINREQKSVNRMKSALQGET